VGHLLLMHLTRKVVQLKLRGVPLPNQLLGDCKGAERVGGAGRGGAGGGLISEWGQAVGDTGTRRHPPPYAPLACPRCSHGNVRWGNGRASKELLELDSLFSWPRSWAMAWLIHGK
jgi:hypothetical protein